MIQYQDKETRLWMHRIIHFTLLLVSLDFDLGASPVDGLNTSLIVLTS